MLVDSTVFQWSDADMKSTWHIVDSSFAVVFDLDIN